MAQGGGRRPSSAISEGLGGGSKWEETGALCARRSVFNPLTVSVSQAVTFFGGHPHSACLLYRKSFKCVKLIISVTQLIDRVQSAGSWAWVPSWYVGEEIPSLNVITKIQLSLWPSSISPVSRPQKWPSMAPLLANDRGMLHLHTSGFWRRSAVFRRQEPQDSSSPRTSSAGHMGVNPRLETPCVGLRSSQSAAQTFF